MTPGNSDESDSSSGRFWESSAAVSESPNESSGGSSTEPTDWVPTSCPICSGGPLIADGSSAICSSCDREYTEDELCEECGGCIDYSNSPPHCRDCGIVVDDTPSLESQHGWETARDNKRTGPVETETKRNRGHTTSIGEIRDINVSLSDSQRHRIQRLQNTQRQFRRYGSSERTTKYAMDELSRMVPGLGLPTRVRETAAVIYRQATNKDLHIGRSVEAIATAALYFACQQEDVARRLEKLAEVSRVDQSCVFNAVKTLSQELGIPIKPTDPGKYVSQFASELAVSGETERSARELLEEAESRNVFSGRNPAGLAAAAIYEASLSPEAQHLSQDEVAEATDVSMKTISAAYRKLREDD
ncbi:transcription initiation factor IIB [Salinibaculum rarum]|uniref:transcription initiation factor IIB n=1 Tax=Salinibaculum rarum TaxID=3058903 RepID=UPI00265EE9AE|nr:transcription initiation factor IIB family protein [Salinibaculum sp. KK48]